MNERSSTWTSRELVRNPPEKDRPTSKDYDAIILGAGTAGLVAAVEAYNQGMKPVVLEKMDLPAGNSIYAMGGVAACGTRIQKQAGVTESKDDFFGDMMKVSADQADPALTRTYVEHIGEDVDWLQNTIGVKFRKLGKLPYPLLSRLHFVDGGSIMGGGMSDTPGKPVAYQFELDGILRPELLHTCFAGPVPPLIDKVHATLTFTLKVRLKVT